VVPNLLLCINRSIRNAKASSGQRPSHYLASHAVLILCQPSVRARHLNCVLVRGRGIVFRHSCGSLAKRAGKDARDGAIVLFESFWML
jgi:hypothetical protein